MAILPGYPYPDLRAVDPQHGCFGGNPGRRLPGRGQVDRDAVARKRVYLRLLVIFDFLHIIHVVQFRVIRTGVQAGVFALELTEKIANLAPRGQPTSVHQVADRLFPAYKIDGGHAYLAGCTLENRLFMKVTVNRAGGSTSFFLDSAARRLDDSVVRQLGLENTLELEKPPEPVEAELASLAKLAGRMVKDEFGDVSSGNVSNAAEPPRPQVELAALWCKYAQGKLRFTIGEQTADLPFCDWAATLVPPPFVCPYTGRKTFHLAATSDGRIVAAEEIETCAQSGLRLLRDDLIICSVSGKRVSRELTEVCPVTDEHVLSEEMVECESCRQRISPQSVESNRCRACRQPQSLAKDDPRWLRLQEAHPAARRWRRWNVSETADALIFNGSGLFKRILLVLDKDTLQPKHLAVGNRLSPAWNAVEVERIGEVLGE